MQSTPSRARHSASILAPLIKVDIRFASKTSLKNKKGHQPVVFTPLMAFGNFISRPSSGAGYDDQNVNNAYRNTAGAKKTIAGCESSGHRGLKFECSLQVW